MTTNNETPTSSGSFALAVREPSAGPQAIIPHSLQEAMALSAELARSSLIDSNFRAKQADVFHIVCAGLELGIPPIASTRVFFTDHKGLPRMYADGIVAVILARRDVCDYFRLIESTDKIATFATKRKGDPELRMSYTIEQAQRAGLTGKPPWKADPAAMLRHRAKSALARTVYPDLIAGIRAVEDDDETDAANYSAPPPPAPAPAPAEKPAAAPRSRAAAKPAAPPPAPTPPPADPNVIDVEYTESKAEPTVDPAPPDTDRQAPPPAQEEQDFGAEEREATAPADSLDAEFQKFLRALADVKKSPAFIEDLKGVRAAFLPWSQRADVKAAGYPAKMSEAYARRKAELS